jgi:RNA polymerase sigma-70 factor (ECF subfamily)
MARPVPAIDPTAEGDVTEASAASAAAFAALVQQHRAIAYKVAGLYCWRPDEREDLVQDILAQAWRAFPGYDTSRPFATWFYRIALNVAISWVRGPGRRQQQTEPFDADRHDRPATPADPAEDAQVQALYRAIRSFEPLNRALLLLYLDEHSHRDIAHILGLSETNVATKIGRLKLRLKQEMERQS